MFSLKLWFECPITKKMFFSEDIKLLYSNSISNKDSLVLYRWNCLTGTLLALCVTLVKMYRHKIWKFTKNMIYVGIPNLNLKILRLKFKNPRLKINLPTLKLKFQD